MELRIILVIQVLDVSAVLNNNQNLGEKRCVNLPLENVHLQADASYNFRLKSDVSNNSQPITYYTPASDKYQQFLYGGYSLYDPSFVNNYFNYQRTSFLNNAVYDSNTDTVNVNWTIPSIPINPVAYDLSFSNITTNRTDVSYNFFVKIIVLLIPLIMVRIFILVIITKSKSILWRSSSCRHKFS